MCLPLFILIDGYCLLSKVSSDRPIVGLIDDTAVCFKSDIFKMAHRGSLAVIAPTIQMCAPGYVDKTRIDNY